MKKFYPETNKHLGVLTEDQTTQGTGEMTENGPLYDDQGRQLWGTHLGSPTVNRLAVDVGVMEELLASETDKNRRLADTIVQEKIHWED